jgi:hypothetical protein
MAKNIIRFPPALRLVTSKKTLNRDAAVAAAFESIGIACDESWAIRFLDQLRTLGYAVTKIERRSDDDGS